MFFLVLIDDQPKAFFQAIPLIIFVLILFAVKDVPLNVQVSRYFLLLSETMRRPIFKGNRN